MNDNEVISSRDGFNEFHLANYDPTDFKSDFYHYLPRSATQGLTKRPTNEETELDPGIVCLQGWFDHQNTCRELRSERGGTDLSTARMRVLDQAKFPWLLTLEGSWQKGCIELVKYKEEHRSMRVPRSHDLGDWVSNQRRIKKNQQTSQGIGTAGLPRWPAIVATGRAFSSGDKHNTQLRAIEGGCRFTRLRLTILKVTRRDERYQHSQHEGPE